MCGDWFRISCLASREESEVRQVQDIFQYTGRNVTAFFPKSRSPHENGVAFGELCRRLARPGAARTAGIFGTRQETGLRRSDADGQATASVRARSKRREPADVAATSQGTWSRGGLSGRLHRFLSGRGSSGNPDARDADFVRSRIVPAGAQSRLQTGARLHRLQL